MNVVNQSLQTKTHPAFQLIRQQRLDTLNLTVYEYEHKVTGAKHFHLAAPNRENVFMVAFRTVPMDSTGVAHMLEHTVLCGSEKFPVRDPFFLMIRRSLNTFMNAFTSSDYTAFPFASQNKQDFNNLLDIYLDAVFFSRLDPLDFAQEGHRFEFENPADPLTELTYKGIVYNEMKGDVSSPVSVLYDTLKKYLFPTTTYHFNSGGDPKNIPDLTYDGLIDFYRSHYHPANAMFMTFGDNSAFDLQQAFEDKALSRFEPSPYKIEAGEEVRYTETQRVTEYYAVEDSSVEDSSIKTSSTKNSAEESTAADSEGNGAEEDVTNISSKSHVVMAWLLGPSIELDLLLKCNLLSDVLLDTSASPLRVALETTDLASAASPLCGLEESNREMSFMCGLEGCDANNADAIETLILTTLEAIARDGVPVEKLEACLHQLELSQREIGGDGSPFGLQLIFSCLSAVVHRGNPIALLDLEPVLEQLRIEIQDPDFIKQLVQELLLNNTHRVRLTLAPDPALNQRVKKEETDRLALIKQQLTEPEKQKIVELSAALKSRQEQADDVELLPKVGIADIPAEVTLPEGEVGKLSNGIPLDRFHVGSNGLTYCQIICPLPEMDAALFPCLPLYTQTVTEIGSAGRDYLETQHLQHSLTGGMGAYTSVRGAIHNPDIAMANITFSSKTLNPQRFEMMKLLQDTWASPQFDEPNRIRDLIKHSRVRMESSIINNAHGLAMSAASSVFRPVSKLNYHLTGLEGLQAIKRLDDSLDDSQGLNLFIDQLRHLHQLITSNSPRLLIVGEHDQFEESESALERLWGRRPFVEQPSVPESQGIYIPFAAPDLNQCWVTATQVNFCAAVFPAVAENHEDAAVLSVLAGVLSNGYLHKAIREQGGAYGGGASYDAANGLFRFYSYRDPNLSKTFDAFQDAIQWLQTTTLNYDALEEAILGLVSSMDAPGSPAGEARKAFHNGLLGRDAISYREKRSRILGVTVEDVKRVAAQYFNGPCARAVICSEANAQKLDSHFVVRPI
jgi:Zn-dependent M16 (insulinase) family peptidase